VGGFASETPNYVDVGLTLNVEPTIYLNNEVGIRISLEVSTLGEAVTTRSGSVAYRIGTRSATTLLQLKDGENQVLAGLISNEDRSSGSKVPGFGDLPVVGRLFGSTRDQTDRTEIVLSITPHLVRTVQRPAAGASEFGAGTEASFRRRPDSTVRAPVQLPVTVSTAPRAAPAGTPTPAPASERPFSVPPSQLPSLPSGSSPPAGQPAIQVTPVPAPPPATNTQVQ
jgi:general secretion pathway protein D